MADTLKRLEFRSNLKRLFNTTEKATPSTRYFIHLGKKRKEKGRNETTRGYYVRNEKSIGKRFGTSALRVNLVNLGNEGTYVNVVFLISLKYDPVSSTWTPEWFTLSGPKWHMANRRVPPSMPARKPHTWQNVTHFERVSI